MSTDLTRSYTRTTKRVIRPFVMATGGGSSVTPLTLSSQAAVNMHDTLVERVYSKAITAVSDVYGKISSDSLADVKSQCTGNVMVISFWPFDTYEPDKVAKVESKLLHFGAIKVQRITHPTRGGVLKVVCECDIGPDGKLKSGGPGGGSDSGGYSLRTVFLTTVLVLIIAVMWIRLVPIKWKLDMYERIIPGSRDWILSLLEWAETLRTKRAS